MNKKILFLSLIVILIGIIGLLNCIVVADSVTVTIRDYGLNVIVNDQEVGETEERLTISNESSYTITSIKYYVQTNTSIYTEPNWDSVTNDLLGASIASSSSRNFDDIDGLTGVGDNEYLWLRITVNSNIYAVVGFLYENADGNNDFQFGDNYEITVSDD